MSDPKPPAKQRVLDLQKLPSQELAQFEDFWYWPDNITGEGMRSLCSSRVCSFDRLQVPAIIFQAEPPFAGPDEKDFSLALLTSRGYPNSMIRTFTWPMSVNLYLLRDESMRGENFSMSSLIFWDQGNLEPKGIPDSPHLATWAFGGGLLLPGEDPSVSRIPIQIPTTPWW